MAAQMGEVVYQAGENVNLEELWDDTALIKAYEKAVNSFKYGPDSDSVENSNKKKNNRRKRKKNRKQTKGSCDEFDESQVNTTTTNWKIGDKCQSVFSEDGWVYMAEIIDIYEPSTNTCVVRYTDYGNEEEQYLTDLLPLCYKPLENGYEEHDQRTSSVDNGDCTAETSNKHGAYSGWHISDLCTAPEPPHYHLHEAVINSFPSRCTCKVTFIRSRRSHEVKITELQRADSHDHHHTDGSHSNNHAPPFSPFYHPHSHMGIPRPPVPPPPPLISMDDLHGDEESLASMLMSWYLSGYHTGYYKAAQQFRSSSNKVASPNTARDDRPTTSEQSPKQAEMDTKE